MIGHDGESIKSKKLTKLEKESLTQGVSLT